MLILTLFGGAPVPYCPRVGPYVHGVDRMVTAADIATAGALTAQLVVLVRISEVPNTPFTGGFSFRGRWQ